MSKAVNQRFDCAYKQYLNCKILHGGTLLQYFNEDYVIPSPKLTEDQKKVFAKNWSVFPSKSVYPRNLRLYSAVIC